MSNERSPREVCSITIGINGLIYAGSLGVACDADPLGRTASPDRPLSSAGGPQFRLCLGVFLVGGPDCVARGRLLGGDALDLGSDAVESPREAHVLALRLVGAGLARLRDHRVRILEALAERLLDIFVRDGDLELVCGRLEQQLTRDGGR